MHHPPGGVTWIGRRAPSGPVPSEIRPGAAPRAAEVTADRLAGDVATGHGARDLAGITLVLHEPDTAWAR
ncbi:MAG: hypothetical protein JWP46_979 [Modestobacter sp.]|nr:hypothetical protein [Modestobacter sp.]